MKRCTAILIAVIPLIAPQFCGADDSQPIESLNLKNPVYVELYTREEENNENGLQGLIGRVDSQLWGTYFAVELTTDHYYEWAFGKTWKPAGKTYIDFYVARSPWNNRLSLRGGTTFDNGISISFRVRPEFGYDNWKKSDANGNTIDYGDNLSIRTDAFISYNSENYEFFYNRVDLYETKDDISDNFHYGKKLFETDHEFRITYMANKWHPYFQYTRMVNGYDNGSELKDDNRWQIGFALPM